MESGYFLHVLDGRVRIKVPGIKRSPMKASQVERALAKVKGITHVRANAVTGSVLVLYHSKTITPHRIAEALRDLGCPVFNETPPHRSRRLSDFVIQSVAEQLLQRALLAIL